MITKVLVANRGEIALRVIRACKELGLATVAVHSTADADALHVRFADESVCIGPPAAASSYLYIPSLIAAGEVTGADAVHPGYGFLAESSEFAEACESSGLCFIGPPAKLIRCMGDKVQARRLMKQSGVPVVPGSGLLETEKELLQAARDVGFPLIIKAAAGGGGRGMKIVTEPGALAGAWGMARAEAKAAFNDARVYLERYLERPRHVEVQVMADRHGNAVHLGDRECSIQRRHQKLLEEAPAPNIQPEVRQRLGELAVAAIQEIGYHNVGTLEFLMDTDGQCYFMEMNTRIQVEHTVTEMITGIDMVQEQIKLAAGEPLGLTQQDVVLRGCALECRINAEHPDTFAPCPGKISGLNLPGGFGVRVDTAVYSGYVVPPYYDSLIAKLVVHHHTRAGAIRRMKRALSEMVMEGIDTNLELFSRIMATDEFENGCVDTGFLARLIERRGVPEERIPT